jgi:hypothetical protein
MHQGSLQSSHQLVLWMGSKNDGNSSCNHLPLLEHFFPGIAAQLNALLQNVTFNKF